MAALPPSSYDHVLLNRVGSHVHIPVHDSNFPLQFLEGVARVSSICGVHCVGSHMCTVRALLPYSFNNDATPPSHQALDIGW